METMLENPTSAVVGCALTLAFLVAGYCISRQRGWLLAAVVPLLAAVRLLVWDACVLSPREEVQLVIDEGVAAICANDQDRLLALLNPELADATRSRIRWAFGRFHFDSARANSVEITLNDLTVPPTAEATFYAAVHFRDKAGTLGFERYACRMVIQFEKRDGRWVVDSHQEFTPIGQEF